MVIETLQGAGPLVCNTPHCAEASYTIDVLQDGPGKSQHAVVTVEIVGGEVRTIQCTELSLVLEDGRRLNLAVMGYDVSAHVLWFQAAGTFVDAVASSP